MHSRHPSTLNELKRSSERFTTIFLDDGDVLNDNKARASEWLRWIGEFMPLRLGGTAEQWQSANREVFPRVWSNIMRRIQDFPNHQEFQRAYAIDWMTAMCEAVGVTPLPDDIAQALNTELSIYVNARAEVDIAGAADAVRALDVAGYTLYTASGTASWDLQAIMTKMSLTGTFRTLYGPDIVDHVKHGTAYYHKVFDHAGVEPSTALVIDSDAQCCQWAIDAGANAAWIDPEGRGDATSLAMLAEALV